MTLREQGASRPPRSGGHPVLYAVSATVGISVVFVPLQRVLSYHVRTHSDSPLLPLALRLSLLSLLAFFLGLRTMWRLARECGPEAGPAEIVGKMIPAFVIAECLIAAALLPLQALAVDAAREAFQRSSATLNP